jgi:hypothetical protein
MIFAVFVVLFCFLLRAAALLAHAPVRTHIYSFSCFSRAVSSFLLLFR